MKYFKVNPLPTVRRCRDRDLMNNPVLQINPVRTRYAGNSDRDKKLVSRCEQAASAAEQGFGP